MKLNYLAESWLQIDQNWKEFLSTSCGGRLQDIDQQLSYLATEQTIYPPKAQILRALCIAPQKIKVVILGQDPYHGENEANGLSFAVNSGIKLPPSLRNIFKELSAEYNVQPEIQNAALLESWTQQGVLLLNATLTVIKDQANSLAHIGWQTISDQIIHHISNETEHCVFILWGNFARSKKSLIDTNKHLILESVHPSPLSAHRGFFGCNHFKLSNQFLLEHKISPINWI